MTVRGVVMHLRATIIWLAMFVFGAVLARAGAQPAGPANQGACVFQSQGLGKPLNYEPCEPFTTLAATTIDRIPHELFGQNNDPVALALLSDGSPMIEAGDGLFYAVHGRLAFVLRPFGTSCDSRADMWSLIGAFNREAFLKDEATGTVIGVKRDGSFTFKWLQHPQNESGYPSVFVAADRYGTLWFEWRANDRTAVYAYAPRTHVATSFKLSFVVGAFRSPNGRVYAATESGLFELNSRPNVSVRLVHAPIPAPSPAPNQLGSDWPYGPSLAIRGVGPDGSLWASTVSQVIHVRPDGTTRVIRVAPPANGWHGLPGPIPLTMAPDGSIWISWDRLIHITNDDRVQLVTVPKDESWRESLSVSPDGSVWVLAYNEQSGRRDVVHFALNAMRGNAPWQSLGITKTITPPPCR
jgi:hypothetical protein